jgi:hypothetical protein
MLSDMVNPFFLVVVFAGPLHLEASSGPVTITVTSAGVVRTPSSAKALMT